MLSIRLTKRDIREGGWRERKESFLLAWLEDEDDDDDDDDDDLWFQTKRFILKNVQDVDIYLYYTYHHKSSSQVGIMFSSFLGLGWFFNVVYLMLKMLVIT